MLTDDLMKTQKVEGEDYDGDSGCVMLYPCGDHSFITIGQTGMVLKSRPVKFSSEKGSWGANLRMLENTDNVEVSLNCPKYRKKENGAISIGGQHIINTHEKTIVVPWSRVFNISDDEDHRPMYIAVYFEW